MRAAAARLVVWSGRRNMPHQGANAKATGSDRCSDAAQHVPAHGQPMAADEAAMIQLLRCRYTSACGPAYSCQTPPNHPPDDQYRHSIQPLSFYGCQYGPPRCAARLAVVAAAVLLPHLHLKHNGQWGVSCTQRHYFLVTHQVAAPLPAGTPSPACQVRPAVVGGRRVPPRCNQLQCLVSRGAGPGMGHKPALLHLHLAAVRLG